MITQDTTPALSVEGLRKSFHGTEVLKGISFEIAPGELTVVIGPSGCGKSTLLRCLNGLEMFDEGSVHIAGIHLRRHTSGLHDREFIRQAKEVRKSAGMVFQSFNLFPHLTVLQNITLAPGVVQGRMTKEVESHAFALLRKVGLESHAHHYPSQLSGGQQQRAAIARALAMKPSVMLYDEPTSALDPTLVEEVLDVMRKLDEEGLTQIVVTHEMRFARQVADRVIFMEHGQIVESSHPSEMFSQPWDERTRKFLKHYLTT